jgi:biopolymer transport protein ExbB/TolQ
MWDLFRQAGWVAWPLGLCSVLAVGIVLERLVTLGNLARLEEEAFAALLRDGDPGPTGSAAPVAAVLAAVRPLRGAGEDTIFQAVEVALGQQRLRLRRYLAGLATIGSTAPFIGLFGTVLGVMTAFRGMSQSGLSGETMASGISEALSATALGLLVAIPAVFAYNYFVGRVQSFMLHVHAHVVRLLPQVRDGAAGE